MLEIITLNKDCIISEVITKNDYLLDITSEDKSIGILNILVKIDIVQNCYEENKLQKLTPLSNQEYTLENMNRFKLKLDRGIDFDNSIQEAVVRKEYIKELIIKLTDEEFSVLIPVEKKELKMTYKNEHNGYYAHKISIEQNGKVVYVEL